jgi:hypothetical protein
MYAPMSTTRARHHRHYRPVALDADLQLVLLLAGMVGRHQMLAPVLDPLQPGARA